LLRFEKSSLEKAFKINIFKFYFQSGISDGVHYVWATTAPRLRVSNGWKVSHYHGILKHDYVYPSGEKQELWQVGYQPNEKTKQIEITKPTIQLQKQQETG
jgi:hypothetical protein